ncbi:MAG: flagellar basal body L-ring protein FlgH [Nitrosomonadales bacterium]|nr:flagellar basal body L-ring protein FlgH [Nitrosomonadales bacterium]
MGSVAMLLAGCASAPSTNIQQPMTARPAVPMAASPSREGAIFQIGQNERPLFEDRHARNVGDTLVINIAEVTTAADASAHSSSEGGSYSMSTPSITGGVVTKTLLHPYTSNGNANGSIGNKGANSGNNTFTGTISVTVIEVLPNGNLLVSGEKQVAIGMANEYIRFSGVVNPVNITSTNTVLSTQVADAHVEYKGVNNIDKATLVTILGRVFLSVLPF